MNSLERQPWLQSASFDLVWIIGPLFFSTLLALALGWLNPSGFSEVPLWGWVVLVMCIDVAHVYSTLYRTYLDPEERKDYGGLLIAIPLICWITGVILYTLSSKLFWTVLAYVAVYHFVRQQYGFMMLYARKDIYPGIFKAIDRLAIYAVTLYPLIFWHTHLPRTFEWFIPGDFLVGLSPKILPVAFFVSVALTLLFALKEIWILVRFRTFNLAKNLLLLGTALAWYIGIVSLNADLPFTITNVISHGVPYIALIWLYGKKKSSTSIIHRLFNARALPIFVSILLALAYIEESLWDALVWRDHESLFSWVSWLPQLTAPALLAIIVPLLAVPQATHYVLDGFIWRIRKPNHGFSALLTESKGVQ